MLMETERGGEAEGIGMIFHISSSYQFIDGTSVLVVPSQGELQLLKCIKNTATEISFHQYIVMCVCECVCVSIQAYIMIHVLQYTVFHTWKFNASILHLHLGQSFAGFG